MDFYARYKKLIYGGIFLVVITLKQLFNIDIGTWFGVTADVDPETGAFIATGIDKIADVVLMLLGLVGIGNPKNAPARGVAEVKVDKLSAAAATEAVKKAEATGAGLPDPVKPPG